MKKIHLGSTTYASNHLILVKSCRHWIVRMLNTWDKKYFWYVVKYISQLQLVMEQCLPGLFRGIYCNLKIEFAWFSIWSIVFMFCYSIAITRLPNVQYHCILLNSVWCLSQFFHSDILYFSFLKFKLLLYRSFVQHPYLNVGLLQLRKTRTSFEILDHTFIEK